MNFFEASSIRKVGEKYYFVYSSILYHELCYAISDSPIGPFKYMGTVVSACDIGIDSYKPADMAVAPLNNNHGGMVCLNGQWYIFYHRHTNGHGYSRQGCAEPIEILENGSIPQARISGCGLNGGPLEGKGEYPAYIVCQMFQVYDPQKNQSMELQLLDVPRLTMEGVDGEQCEQYITNIKHGAVIGFCSFDFKNITKISVRTAGYIQGSVMEVATSWDGEAIGVIPLSRSNDWSYSSAEIAVPDGVHDLYFRYKGDRGIYFAGFVLE